MNTDMARELAARFCEMTIFKIYGVDRLQTFLNTPFMIPGFFPRDHLRNLLVILRPPYWDLPLFPDSVSANYGEVLSSNMHMLEQLLQVQHKSGFHLRIIIVVTWMFDQGFMVLFRPNMKFCRWMEVATPLLVRFIEQGFRLEIEYLETDGEIADQAQMPGKRITVATLFNQPSEEWQAKIEDGSAFVSHNYWFVWGQSEDILTLNSNNIYRADTIPSGHSRALSTRFTGPEKYPPVCGRA
jgi:hypothetical protein